MHFLVDAQLPPSLVPVLAEFSQHASHVQDLLGVDASDSAIWALALSRSLVIVTKDEDFAHRAAVASAAPAIVWLRLGNMRNAALRAALGPVWPAVQEALQRGERVVEVRAR